MKRAIALLAIISLPVEANMVLHVHAPIKNFKKAEESSYLLQCLTEDHQITIQFVESASATRPLLQLTETKDGLLIDFDGAEKWKHQTSVEAVVSHCGKLALLVRPLEQVTPLPQEPGLPPPPPKTASWWKRNQTWLIAVGVVSAGAAAYFLTRPGPKGFSELRPELRP